MSEDRDQKTEDRCQRSEGGELGNGRWYGETDCFFYDDIKLPWC